jgi:hypothetical protein
MYLMYLMILLGAMWQCLLFLFHISLSIVLDTAVCSLTFCSHDRHWGRLQTGSDEHCQ